MSVDSVFGILPGKTGDGGAYLPLWMHMEDTAAVMEYLCLHRVSDSVISACGMNAECFRKISVFLAYVHDIGKCTPLFASKILMFSKDRQRQMEAEGLFLPAALDYYEAKKSPHAFAGEEILRALHYPSGIYSVVGAHHGKPSSKNLLNVSQLDEYPRNYYGEDRALWEQLRSAFLSKALMRSGYSDARELPVLSQCAQLLLCGLVIQADWIASNPLYFPLLSAEEIGTPALYPNRSALALSRLNLPERWKSGSEALEIPALYQKRFGFLPNSMQSQVAELIQTASNPGLILLEARMGTGKTEAALIAAEILNRRSGCGGVFFGLPTQATSNGIFPRLAEWTKNISEDETHSIRLVHGMAEFNEDYLSLFHGTAHTDDEEVGGLSVHPWFSGKKQALLADFVVGTVDTALMSALRQKHIMLRHLGLCGKVVVIDECHAYDAYMGEFLCCMLRWLGAYHVPVVLLSATLPHRSKEKLLAAYTGNKKTKLSYSTAYPSAAWTDGVDIHTRQLTDDTPPLTVNTRRLSDEELVQNLTEALHDGGCAGIIVNTVKRAQAIGNALKRRMPGKEVCVYHAQYLAEERVRREKELTDRVGKHSTPQSRNNVIIVGTQVLEQSLDIDFDYLVSDLCPIDLLLQRMGRLHRHKRIRPHKLTEPVCAVLYADGEFEKGAERIYGTWLLRQTREQLPTQIRLPEDISELVNRVYAAPDIPTPEWEQFETKAELKGSKAKNWILAKPQASKKEALNSIKGMLDYVVETEKHAEATVRDALPSIDVLVLLTADDAHLKLVSGASELTFRMDSVPSEQEARKIAMQRLRLPFLFCVGEQLDRTVSVLEAENAERVPIWQDSPWLKGELIFMLDENGEKSFADITSDTIANWD